MRLAVIALDGFPYHILREENSNLPNLTKLKKTGSWGKLVSTLPYVTSTAWTSFSTGLNPGKHRVIGFFPRDSQSPTETGRLAAGSTVRGASLWRALSDGGVRVGVFGVPMTYRPEEVNGFMISGFPLPKDSKDYTYPSGLREDLEAEGWDFADVPAQAFSKGGLDEFYADLEKKVDEKTEAVLYLLKRFELDFFMVHYFETDKVLHEFLNFRYPRTSTKKDYQKYHDYVDRLLIRVDESLGRVVKQLGDSCDLLVVSDHGLSPGNNLFLTDTWLLKKGYTRIRRRPASQVKYALFRVGVTPEFALRRMPGFLTDSLLRTFFDDYWEHRGESGRSGSALGRLLYSLVLSKKSDVDWARSVAYSHEGSPAANVYLKPGLPPNEAEALKGRIADELRSFSRGGRRVFDHVVLDSEEYVWDEPRPDVPEVFAYCDGCEFRGTTNPAFFTSRKVVTNKFAKPYAADHDRDGIFVAFGSTMSTSNECGPLSIMDMNPTILHYFGLAISDYTDGRVANILFRDGSEPRSRAPKFAKREAPPLPESVFTKEEEFAIVTKLKDMGYI